MRNILRLKLLIFLADESIQDHYLPDDDNSFLGATANVVDGEAQDSNLFCHKLLSK